MTMRGDEHMRDRRSLRLIRDDLRLPALDHDGFRLSAKMGVAASGLAEPNLVVRLEAPGCIALQPGYYSGRADQGETQCPKPGDPDSP